MGGIIRFHRKECGLSQQALADLAGVGLSSIKDAEAGKSTLQLDTLLKIFGALGIHFTFESKLMQNYDEQQNKEMIKKTNKNCKRDGDEIS